jgi:hypothetical protein
MSLLEVAAKEQDKPSKEFQVTVRMNWKLLRKQKRILLGLLNQSSLALRPEQRDAIDGIINLLDCVQDQAVDSGEFTERQVFGKAEKELELATDEPEEVPTQEPSSPAIPACKLTWEKKLQLIECEGERHSIWAEEANYKGSLIIIEPEGNAFGILLYIPGAREGYMRIQNPKTSATTWPTADDAKRFAEQEIGALQASKPATS